MAIHDTIGDMLCIIRNGIRSAKPRVAVRRSKLNVAILEVLKREHYLYDFKQVSAEAEAGQNEIRVYLRAPASVKEVGRARVRKINKLMRVSRPGLRIYTTAKDMPRILRGLGTCVVSTSKGVMTGQDARKGRMGGEVLLKVW